MGVQRDRRKWSLHQAWHAEVFARQKRLKQFVDVLGEDRYRPTMRKSVRENFAALKAMARSQKKRAQRKKAADVSAEGVDNG